MCWPKLIILRGQNIIYSKNALVKIMAFFFLWTSPNKIPLNSIYVYGRWQASCPSTDEPRELRRTNVQMKCVLHSLQSTCRLVSRHIICPSLADSLLTRKSVRALHARTSRPDEFHGNKVRCSMLSLSAVEQSRLFTKNRYLARLYSHSSQISSN